MVHVQRVDYHCSNTDCDVKQPMEVPQLNVSYCGANSLESNPNYVNLNHNILVSCWTSAACFCWFGSIFDPEDGGNMCLRTTRHYTTDGRTLHVYNLTFNFFMTRPTEESYCLGYNAIQSSRSSPTFRRNLLPLGCTYFSLVNGLAFSSTLKV
jgi:hypothetical protein